MLDPAELERVREIDRTEQIDALYVQHGARLEERAGDSSSADLGPGGNGEHSVAALLEMLEQRIEPVRRQWAPSQAIDSWDSASCYLIRPGPRSSSPST